jgi:3-oxoacyl-[acyl-carrier protein] reductase
MLPCLTPEIWDRVLATNLRGPYLLSRALAPHLRKNGAGRIVNIASVAGLTPGGSSIAYAASKAALIHLTRCLAVALAPEVTVNCIAPGLVEGTRMAERVPDAVKKVARSQAVLGRTGSIQDIAEQAIAFCRAESVTGQVIVVDGGLPAGMR